MTEPLLIWGAKGHALVLNEFAASAGFHVAALVDNAAGTPSPIEGVPVVHGLDGLDAWLGANDAGTFAVAIGGGFGRDRIEIDQALRARGLKPATLIHPWSYVAGDTTLGDGAQVLAGAVVATSATVGRQTIVNTSASVDHECVLGDGVHIGPGATLAGLVHVGDGAFVGAGATVLPRIHIGADSTVGAGAVVTRDVPEGATVAGVPARPT